MLDQNLRQSGGADAAWRGICQVALLADVPIRIRRPHGISLRCLAVEVEGLQMRLEGKIAIVTGAGTGIGEAFSHKFAQEGARLMLAGLSDDLVKLC